MMVLEYTEYKSPGSMMSMEHNENKYVWLYDGHGTH